jgi:hypothetical protein
MIMGSRRFLQDIDLTGCPQLTDDDAVSLVRLCPAIERFNVTGCRNLTSTTVTLVGQLVQTAIERRSRANH